MKIIKIILVACYSLFFNQLFAQQVNTIAAVSEISKVTVFLQGAQITRSAEVQLPKGECYVVFAGMPEDFIVSDIKVGGVGEYELLAVNKTNASLYDVFEPQIVDSSKYQKNEAAYAIAHKRYLRTLVRQKALNEEKSLIVANKNLAGSEGGGCVTASELRQVADLYRTRLVEIGDLLNEAGEEIREFRKLEKGFKKRKYELTNYPLIESSSSLLLSISSYKQQFVNFEVSYYSDRPYWYPGYFFRVDNLGKAPVLTYKSLIFQNTYEDWDKIKLTLSTARPNFQSKLPVGRPRIMTLADAPVSPSKTEIKKLPNLPAEYRTRTTYKNVVTETGKTIKEAIREQYMPREYSDRQEFVSTVDKPLATDVSFEMEGRHTIGMKTQGYGVFMKTLHPKVEYEHYCFPSLDQSAYLTVKMPDWEQYNLMDGKVSLYYEGNFVGSTNLNTKMTKDTLVMSMGKDQNVAVERIWKGVKTVKSRGGNLEEQHAYQIKVLNKKNVPINLLIEDQLPVSGTDEIKVEAVELSNARHEKETGKLLWRFQLAPGQSKRIDLKYNIQYPKDKILISKKGEKQ